LMVGELRITNDILEEWRSASLALAPQVDYFELTPSNMLVALSK
jgi:hypothetical protein